MQIVCFATGIVEDRSHSAVACVKDSEERRKRIVAFFCRAVNSVQLPPDNLARHDKLIRPMLPVPVRGGRTSRVPDFNTDCAYGDIMWPRNF
jgi:hypothetical protein